MNQVSWIIKIFGTDIGEALYFKHALVSTTFFTRMTNVKKLIEQNILSESKLPKNKSEQECWE